MTSLRFSANFTQAELTKSRRALRDGIANEPNAAQLVNLEALAVKVLQPIRDEVGRPLVLESGFRSWNLNAAERGATDSQHLALEDNAAADWEVPGVDNLVMAHRIRALMEAGLPVDQLILEFYVVGIPSSGWLHTSHRRVRLNRGNVLTATWDAAGKRVYVPGLPALPAQ